MGAKLMSWKDWIAYKQSSCKTMKNIARSSPPTAIAGMLMMRIGQNGLSGSKGNAQTGF